MNADRLAELHEVLKEPLRQKILLQLGQHDVLSFETLAKNLRIEDPQELNDQIKILSNLLEEKYLPDPKGSDVAVYALTEEGHEVLDAMIMFPELTSKDYLVKPKPKWFTPYWIALFLSTAIIVGVLPLVFGHQSIESVIFYLAVALSIEGLAVYVRIKPPSKTTNRIMYIVLFGACFGCWFSIAAIVVLSHYGFREIDAVVITVWTGCFVLGGLLGELIGRMRHYKGPQQYQF
jgi:hypothetical protein